MGIFDAIKGLLGGDGLQGVLDSTGLSEHVEGILGEGSALAEDFGVDLGQATEALGVDGVAESLPGGIGDIVQGATEGGSRSRPADDDRVPVIASLADHDVRSQVRTSSIMLVRRFLAVSSTTSATLPGRIREPSTASCAPDGRHRRRDHSGHRCTHCVDGRAATH